MGLLGWALVALFVSAIAGGLGFTGVAQDARAIAKFCFVLFLVIALALFVMVMLGVGAVAAGGAMVQP